MKDKTKFVEEIIASHNKRRKTHGCPDLKHNSELGEQAQEWADKIATKGYVSYCETAGVGENITIFPPNLQPDKIVEHWYSEHEKYEYETPGWQEGTSYFTQMIWKSTKEIGIGRSVIDADKFNSPISQCNKIFDKLEVIVAFYRPAGNNNRDGLFAINVLKPKYVPMSIVDHIVEPALEIPF